MEELLPTALDRVDRFPANRACHTSHSYGRPMTTFAVSPADLDSARADDLDLLLPRTVANPRRTIWTGFAKDDLDRLPSS